MDNGLEWRERLLASIDSDDFSVASDSLLSLSYHEPDREWLEDLLVGLAKASQDPQIRALAVVCIGHVARIHQSITYSKVVPALEELRSIPELESRVANALEDIEIFTGYQSRG